MPMTLHRDAVDADPEIQRLAQEHSRYEAQLQQLTTSPYLSAEDILLEVDLKKMKLRVSLSTWARKLIFRALESKTPRFRARIGPPKRT